MSIKFDGTNGALLNTDTQPSPNIQFKNKLINGDFEFWQRGVVSGSVTNEQYFSDRWVYNLTGSTCTASRQAFTLGQTSVPDNPWYFNRSVVTSSAGASNSVTMSQRIEDVTRYSGQTLTLSFWAKCGTNKSISTEFIQNFGTGGSPSATVTAIGVQKHTLSTSWEKYTVTVTIPSVSGKTLGTNGNHYLGLIFWFDAGSSFNSRTDTLGQQSDTFDIAHVQLEDGSSATSFEYIDRILGIFMCQRYYQIITSYYISWGGATAQVLLRHINRPAVMRASPTDALSSKTDTGGTAAVNTSTATYAVIQMTASAAFSKTNFTITSSAEL